ncbi:SCO6881 family protein [Streptomyces antibioticus]|uniref:ATP-binding protein n=1 Tax=Streptomyces antibioticus TaxID=1890 RepID=A0AAE6Y4K0_STRAT|nr:ATP-binding protein [Streptomyces antibioticus]OOQ55335.1 ATP-binding protein [Streptomyces antibioticus]QIT42973.1 ATP-binding protein [Streptomyces antibioticus]
MGFCDLPVAGKLCTVGDVIDFASDPVGAIGDWMAKSAGDLAAAAADLAAKAINRTTDIDLGAGWFRDNYETILPIGLLLLVATFCAQLVRAAIKRDGQALTQAVTGTASGVLFAFCAIAFTTVALEVVDALSDGLFKASGTDMSTAVRRLVKISQIGAIAGMGWLVAVVAACASAIGMFLFWGVMMVRKVGILILVTLAVFAGAGGGWEVARRWRRGWIEATATLVVSKLLMTIIFVLGIAAMSKTEAKDGVAALADMAAGMVIMLLVLLCPYMVFKFVHWASEGTDGESIHRAGGAGAQMARQHAENAGRKAASAAATAGTGGAAAGAGAAGGTQAAGGGGFPGDIAANPTGGMSMDKGDSGSDSSGGGFRDLMEQSGTPQTPNSTGQGAGQDSGPPNWGGGGGQQGEWSSSAPSDPMPPAHGAPSAGDSTQSGSPTGL